MLKAGARNIYRKKRQQLGEETRHSYDRSIAFRFINEFTSYKTIHLFLPIEKNFEPDTLLIAQKLYMSAQTVICTSIIHGEHLLKHVIIKPPFQYPVNKWGIPVPPEEPVIDVNNIDLVLVPLLAYDKAGNRVGYGKGFYDRFLAVCKPDCPRVGLSYFPPEDKIEDVQEFDIRLTHCITPEKTWTFGAE